MYKTPLTHLEKMKTSFFLSFFHFGERKREKLETHALSQTLNAYKRYTSVTLVS
jgi:hypothetical protein